ncbi:Uncharacterised protein [Acinetobacter baumannii]|nr:Uncharacterised protein [Acinetobacter baumannii]
MIHVEGVHRRPQPADRRAVELGQAQVDRVGHGDLAEYHVAGADDGRRDLVAGTEALLDHLGVGMAVGTG